MPNFHSANVDGVDLFVRPIGWRRWFKFYPYTQGNKVRFRIGVKRGQTKISPLGRIAIYEDIQLPEGSRKPRFKLLTDPYLQSEKESYPSYLDITGSILSVAGYGHYTINEPANEKATEIVTFKVLSDATMFMWLTPSILALLSIIISIILWVFFPPRGMK